MLFCNLILTLRRCTLYKRVIFVFFFSAFYIGLNSLYFIQFYFYLNFNLTKRDNSGIFWQNVLTVQKPFLYYQYEYEYAIQSIQEP